MHGIIYSKFEIITTVEGYFARRICFKCDKVAKFSNFPSLKKISFNILTNNRIIAYRHFFYKVFEALGSEIPSTSYLYN